MAPETLDYCVGTPSDVFALGVVILQVRAALVVDEHSMPCLCQPLLRCIEGASWPHGVHQVASGLPAYVDRDVVSLRSAKRSVHLRQYLRGALLDGTLPALSLRPWTADRTLSDLVSIGLACCEDDPDARMPLETARHRLAGLLDPLLLAARVGARGGGSGEACARSVSACMLVVVFTGQRECPDRLNSPWLLLLCVLRCCDLSQVIESRDEGCSSSEGAGGTSGRGSARSGIGIASEPDRDAKLDAVTVSPRCQVMFMGSGGAGKTTLAHRLVSGVRPVDTAATHGVRKCKSHCCGDALATATFAGFLHRYLVSVLVAVRVTFVTRCCA